MAFVQSDTKRKIDSIVSNIADYTVLIDKPNVAAKGKFDFVPGLGMETEAKAFRELSNDIKKGVFKMLVMGKFKNGKSTIINALIGKVIMARRATACTAVIATVEYGKDIDSVRIIYTPESKLAPRKITLEKFSQDFMLTDEEERCVEAGGQLNRFANVSHVEMQSDDSLFSDGMRLTDSPGLEDRLSCTNATNNYVSKANAIIFTLNATSLFSAKEREYISDNFAGKHMTNLFFLVNRVNQLVPGQLESSVIPGVKNGLKDVFVDENGRFDEKLYNRRVFFVDAYGAECARTGEPYKIKVGNREMTVPIEFEDTGMVAFEDELRAFLNSAERINATFSSTLTGMANVYQSAAKKVAADKRVRSLSADKRKENAALAQQKLQEAEDKVADIRTTIRNSAELVASKLYVDLLTLIQRDIPDDFAEYVKDKNVQDEFGVGSMMKLIWYNIIDRDPEPVVRPFVEHTQKYIAEKIDLWAKQRAPLIIQNDVAEMKQNLDEQVRDFDLHMEEAVNLFAYGVAHVPGNEDSSMTKGGLQALLSVVLFGDFGGGSRALAAGGLNWIDFAKNSGTQLAADFAVGFIFGGILGAPVLIPLLVARFLLLRRNANIMAEQLSSGIGNAAFEALGEKIRDDEAEFKSKIVDKFVDQGERIAIPALKMVEDARHNQEKLLKEDADDTAAAEAENERADKNLQSMHRLIDGIYSELYGRTPTESEFNNLAKKSTLAV